MKNRNTNSARIIDMVEVRSRTNLSTTTIWRLRNDGNFPDPVRISANRVGWIEAEIDSWIRQRINHRNADSGMEGADV